MNVWWPIATNGRSRVRILTPNLSDGSTSSVAGGAGRTSTVRGEIALLNFRVARCANHRSTVTYGATVDLETKAQARRSLLGRGVRGGRRSMALRLT